MNKSQNRAYRSEDLSLFPLDRTLANAKQDVPPQSSRTDVNEEMVRKLIAKMREDYQQRGRPVHWVGGKGPTKTAE